MPYYQEVSARVPRTVQVQQTHIPTKTISTPVFGTDWDEWTRMTTYRTGAPKGNVKAVVLSDITADKYAYFLNSTRDHKFESALRARGFDLTTMPPDRGHPFTLERFKWLWRGQGRVTRSGYYHWDVSGWAPVPFGSSIEPKAPASTADAFAYQSWGRLAPTTEVFDLAQFVGELREGLPGIVPSLLKGKSSFFKDLGSDYLNIEFGWKPFLSDLQDAARALLSAQESITRPFGPVHRTRESEPFSSTESLSGPLGITCGGIPQAWLSADDLQKIEPGYTAQPAGFENFQCDTTVFVERKSWFEANWFALPKIGYDPQNFVSRLDSLMDSKITPAVLWELAPWSWLVDWGLRIGDALQTAERLADDRVHAQYAYGMELTRVRRHIKARTNGLSAASLYERKERVRANPYGFVVGGVASLNSWQQSILLALGLTKLK